MSTRTDVLLFLGILGAAAVAAALPAQQPRGVLVSTTAGRLVEGVLEAVDAERVVVRTLVDDGGGVAETLPRDEVVAIAAGAPRVAGRVRVELVGGDVLRGRLGAGDAAGDRFRIESPVLGRLELPVDRLRRAVFAERSGGAGPRAFVLPPGEDFGEAVFRPVERGFDRTLGAIFRFADDALLFARDGTDEPAPIPYDELAAIVVGGGFDREDPAIATVVTRLGDAVGVMAVGFADGRYTVELETGAQLELAAAEVAAVSFRRPALARLADLPFAAVHEHAHAGEDVAPLWAARRRGEVATGAPLRAGGRGFGDGLGVHTHSALSFEVPDGVTGLVGLVGIDDVVLDLGVRGAAAIEVRVDGKRAFAVDAVRAGQAPRSVGRIPVAPGQTVELVATFGPGFDLGDRVDWLEFAFVP